MKYELNLSKGLIRMVEEKCLSKRNLAKIILDGVVKYNLEEQDVGLGIDFAPADNGKKETVKYWTSFFNSQGKAMISAFDVYRAPDSVLPSLREDFNGQWLVTSTRVTYSSDNLSARIIHNYGSKVVTPTQREVIIPFYMAEKVENVVKGEGLKYLQTLFDTEDSAFKLIGRLEDIGGKEAKDIVISTPNQDSRGHNFERAIDFVYHEDRFNIDSNWFLEVSIVGRARGVSVKSAEPTA